MLLEVFLAAQPRRGRVAEIQFKDRVRSNLEPASLMAAFRFLFAKRKAVSLVCLEGWPNVSLISRCHWRTT
jgi:hypothetical protein